MRLLVFTPYYPPHVGGLESHAAQFNAALTAAGWKIIVFTAAIPPQAGTSLSPHQIIRFPAFEIIPGYPFPKFWTRDFRRAWQTIARQTPTITLSRTRFFITSLMAFAYRLTHATTWIHIEHGSDYMKLRSPLSFVGWLYDQTVGRFIFWQADQVVANSKATQHFIHRFTRRPVPVIYRGVDISRIKQIPADTRSVADSNQLPVIMYVGRLMVGKGVQDLIAAIKLLEPPSTQLVIIGDGPHKHELIRLSQVLGLAGRIHFLGEVAWEQTIGLLKAADIVVNPSYTEGLPSAVIEAALCRRAIVATAVGGTSEIVRHDHEALLVPPHDPPTLAAAITQLLTQPSLRAKLGENAYQRAAALFTWAPAIKKYQALFKPYVRE